MAARGKAKQKVRKETGAARCPLEDAQENNILQVLDREGKVNGQLPEPDIDEATLIRLYEMMVLVRAIDERGFKLQRSGRVEFWIPHRGLEAVHTAATLALDDNDWIFLGYRHPGCMLLRGVPLLQMFAQFFGREGDPLKGRRLPTLMGDRRVNIVPMTTQVGSYIPHAAGAAWAARLRGDDTRFLVFFGDGSTSRGEFHSALNFSGIHRPPVIFLCENNGWAVSTPTTAQTATATFAEKGNAYGITNLRVDGNDPLAVFSVVRDAYRRCHEDGPTLIEAVTYRMGLHTTSDDPNLYREEAEVEMWAQWDPLPRMRNYLEARDLWDAAREEALWSRCRQEIATAVTEAEALPFPAPETMFDDTFETPTWLLKEQKQRLLGELDGKA